MRNVMLEVSCLVRFRNPCLPRCKYVAKRLSKKPELLSERRWIIHDPYGGSFFPHPMITSAMILPTEKKTNDNTIISVIVSFSFSMLSDNAKALPMVSCEKDQWFCKLLSAWYDRNVIGERDSAHLGYDPNVIAS